MITVESSVGVLVELRFVGSPSVLDVHRFVRETASIVKRTVKHEKRRALVCTDLSACGLLAPEVSEQILAFMRHDTPHIERNAFLGNASALVLLQLQRVITEAGERDRRRIFKTPAPLMDWLGEVSNDAERKRLKAFLLSAPPPAS
jgi:hypothetical protein